MLGLLLPSTPGDRIRRRSPGRHKFLAARLAMSILP